MRYVSYRQLLADTLAWERQLPQCDAFVGVPRSGLLPATLLALRRNVRLVDLSRFLEDPLKAVADAPLRGNNPAQDKELCGRAIIIDDATSENGATLGGLREACRELPLKVEYGAVYRATQKCQADHSYRLIPQPRLFEWNWFRHWKLPWFLLDIDGVVCEDWPHASPETEQDSRMLRHIAGAKPLYLPERPVMGLVTSRLEVYRPQTEAWLARHDVRYENLWMYPGKSARKRQARADHGQRKSKVYRDCADALLFVESSRKQAGQIAKLAGRSVLCLETQEMLQP